MRRLFRKALAWSASSLAVAGMLITLPTTSLLGSLPSAQAAVATGDVVYGSADWTGIYLRRAIDETSIRLSTSNNDMYPDISPAGNQIALVSNDSGWNLIYVMNSDGSGKTQITTRQPTDPGFADHSPRWSPDSQWIVFTRSISRTYGTEYDLMKVRPEVVVLCQWWLIQVMVA